jgi:hypothetical protein
MSWRKCALVAVVLGSVGAGVTFASEGDQVSPKKGTWEGTTRPFPSGVPVDEPNVEMEVGKKRVKTFLAALPSRCEVSHPWVFWKIRTSDFRGKGEIAGRGKKPRFLIYAPLNFGGHLAHAYMSGRFLSKRKAKGWARLDRPAIDEYPGCRDSTGKVKWVATPARLIRLMWSGERPVSGLDPTLA